MVAGGSMTAQDAVRHVLALGDGQWRGFVEQCLDRYAADDLLPAFKAEAERNHGSDGRAALRLGEALIYAAERAGRPDHRALGLIAKGDAHHVLGNYQE